MSHINMPSIPKPSLFARRISYHCLALERDTGGNSGIVTLYLNRPDKKNAMSFALLEELYCMAKELAQDKTVRVIILRGKGGSFSAGIDLADLGNPKKMPFALWELVKPTQSLFQKAFTIMQSLPIPVIAVTEGHCIGAGMQLAMAADIRISDPECQFAIMESRWGLVPDMGITTTMQGLVRPDIAKELTMTARMIDAKHAEKYGLVTHVSNDPMSHAVELANELLSRSPDSVLGGKRIINTMLQRSFTNLYKEKYWQLKMMLGKNSRIAMATGKGKNASKQPAFKARQYK